MSNEKQNKGWKETLLAWEKAGGHPEEGGNLLWERLEAKLEPRRRKKTYFLWAAAIFLPVAGIFMFFQRQQPAVINSDQPGQAVQVQPPIKEEKEARPSSSVQAASLLPIENRTVQAGHPRISPPADSQVVITEERPLNPDTAIVASNQPVNPAPPIIPAHTPKKIRVVHLNDWNAPPPPTYATLKESWDKTRTQADIDPEPGRSMWPGKNRNKTPVSSAN